MQPDERFSDLIPAPTEDDLFFMKDELRELSAHIHRNDLVVLTGGPVVAWWGFCSAIAGFWNFLIESHLVPFFPVVLINAGAGYLGSFLVIRLMKTGKILSQDTKAIAAVWLGVAVAMPVMIAGMVFRKADDSIVVCGLQCILFAIAFMVSASGSRQKWLRLPTIAWAVMSLVIFFVVDTHWRPLVFALAILAFMTAPGLYLGWIYRRDFR